MANTVLSLMTAVVSLTLAILLFSITLGKTDTHIIIFITGGFLFAMCAWQVQTFIRNLLLKKQLKQPQNIRLAQPDSIETNLRYEKSTQTNKLLDVADFSNIVPPSVVENTTKHLKEKIIN